VDPARERLAVSVTLSGLGRLFAAPSGSREPLAPLLEAARVADAAGIDQLVVTDHLAIGPRTDRYPYGRFPFAPDEPWPEPLALLAALGAVTRRVRLATGILIAPLRPALLLAKSAATLDVLCAGRLDLGVGTGWQREEFAAAGVPFAGRAARMDDTLRACRALWGAAPASFRSPTVVFDELWCLPRPVQPGGPPIWIGGAATPANVARLVEYGAGWMPIASDAELAQGMARLREALAAAGRAAGSLAVRAAPAPVLDARGRPDLERTIATLPRLRALGASHASFAIARFAERPEQVRPVLERLGRLAESGA
jgi:probable F420-dependent oxidoreductase